MRRGWVLASLVAVLNAAVVTTAAAGDAQDALKGLPTIRGESPEAYVCVAGCYYPDADLRAERALREGNAVVRWDARSPVSAIRFGGMIDKVDGAWVARRFTVDVRPMDRWWMANLPLRRISAEFERSGLAHDSDAWLARLEALQPDPAAMPAEVGMRWEITDSATCPQLQRVVEALAVMESPRIDIPRIGEGTDPETLAMDVVADGRQNRVIFDHLYIDAQHGSLELAGLNDSAPGRWIELLLEQTRDCWRPDPKRA